VNLQTLEMMLYDAPRYVPGKKKAAGGNLQPGKKNNRIAELYQSRLSNYNKK
jgi:hypothetical protein